MSSENRRSRQGRLGATMKTPSQTQSRTSQATVHDMDKKFTAENFNIKKELEIQKTSKETMDLHSNDADGSKSSLNMQVKDKVLTSPTTSTSNWNPAEGIQDRSKFDDLELL